MRDGGTAERRLLGKVHRVHELFARVALGRVFRGHPSRFSRCAGNNVCWRALGGLVFRNLRSVFWCQVRYVILDDRVLEKIVKPHPLHRVPLQEPPNQRFQIPTRSWLFWEFYDVFRLLDVAQQIDVVRRSEGRFSRRHLIADRTDRPQVRLRVVLLIAQDFGRHIQRRTTQGLRQAFRGQGSGEAEVGQLQHGQGVEADERDQRAVARRERLALTRGRAGVELRRGVDEEVLGLDVAVHQALVAEEFERAGKLFEEVAHEDLVQAARFRVGVAPEDVEEVGVSGEAFAFADEEGEIAHGAVLHDDVDVRRALFAVEQGDHVRMVQVLENLDLDVQILFELLG